MRHALAERRGTERDPKRLHQMATLANLSRSVSVGITAQELATTRWCRWGSRPLIELSAAQQHVADRKRDGPGAEVGQAHRTPPGRTKCSTDGSDSTQLKSLAFSRLRRSSRARR